MERKKLTGAQTRHWTPEENEFLAENEFIYILPFFSSPQFDLIHRKYGPFRPNTPVQVPIWLAVTLRKSKKCKIIPPDWLSPDNLKKCIEEEKNQVAFGQLPFYYREIVKILLCECEDDLKDATNIRILIKDIEEVRKNKTNLGLKQIEPSTYFIGLNNIGACEMSAIRYTVCKTLDLFHEISRLDNNENDNNNGNTQSQSGDTHPDTPDPADEVEPLQQWESEI